MIQQEKEAIQKQKNRRALLRKSLGAVAGVGAVAALQGTTKAAHATGAEGPTQFSGAADVVTVTVTGSSQANAILGGADDVGVVGIATSSGTGVFGDATGGMGVLGRAISGTGVEGQCDTGVGVLGESSKGSGVVAQAKPFLSTDHPTALNVQGTIKVGVDGSGRDNPVGTATIPAGASSVTVTNPVATPNSLVILTPQSDPGATVWVTTMAGSFTIHRAMSFFPIHPAVTFNYFIIN